MDHIVQLPSRLTDQARELKLGKPEAPVELPLADCIPDGTPILTPAYYDEACIGYEFTKTGGIRLVYAGEVCVQVLRRNATAALSYEQAVGHLAEMFGALDAANAPAFVWGFE